MRRSPMSAYRTVIEDLMDRVKEKEDRLSVLRRYLHFLETCKELEHEPPPEVFGELRRRLRELGVA